MNLIIIFFIFVIGISIGSFLNVLIYRIPLSISVAKGRSFCPKCKHTLSALDLIPVFSWLFLGRKCRYCSDKISVQYPLIELITGFLFVIAYLEFGYTIDFLRIAVLFSVLVVISVIDIYEQNIYDITVIFGIVSTLILLVINYFAFEGELLTYFISAGVSFGVYLLIFLISYKIYGEEVFGKGDVFLAILMGLNIPANLLYFTVCFPFIVALACVIIGKLYAVIKKSELDNMVPFGPFMAISCVIVSLYGDHLMNIVF